jgi:hypothetical protein
MRSAAERERPAVGLGSTAALFAALADYQTAAFIKSVFSLPEQRPKVTTERSEFRLGDERFWQVAIIEKPRALRGRIQPLLNVAHVVLGAGDGRIRQRWFLTKVRDEEYREFLREKLARPAGCRGRTR